MPKFQKTKGYQAKLPTLKQNLSKPAPPHSRSRHPHRPVNLLLPGNLVQQIDRALQLQRHLLVLAVSLREVTYILTLVFYILLQLLNHAFYLANPVAKLLVAAGYRAVVAEASGFRVSVGGLEVLELGGYAFLFFGDLIYRDLNLQELRVASVCLLKRLLGLHQRRAGGVLHASEIALDCTDSCTNVRKVGLVSGIKLTNLTHNAPHHLIRGKVVVPLLK